MKVESGTITMPPNPSRVVMSENFNFEYNRTKNDIVMINDVDCTFAHNGPLGRAYRTTWKCAIKNDNLVLICCLTKVYLVINSIIY